MKQNQEAILENIPTNTKRENTNTLEVIAKNSKQERLDMFNSLIYSVQNNKLIRQQLVEIASTYLEAQKEEIKYKTTIKKDLIKKELYGEYQLSVQQLEQKIAQESQNMRDSLLEMIQNNIISIHTRRISWLKTIENMEKDGLLDEKYKNEELQRLQRWIDRSLDELDQEAQLAANSKFQTLTDTFLSGLKP